MDPLFPPSLNNIKSKKTKHPTTHAARTARALEQASQRDNVPVWTFSFSTSNLGNLSLRDADMVQAHIQSLLQLPALATLKPDPTTADDRQPWETPSLLASWTRQRAVDIVATLAEMQQHDEHLRQAYPEVSQFFCHFFLLLSFSLRIYS